MFINHIKMRQFVSSILPVFRHKNKIDNDKYLLLYSQVQIVIVTDLNKKFEQEHPSNIQKQKSIIYVNFYF